MKKLFLLMMCCLAIAFTSCKPDRTITVSSDPTEGGTITGAGTYTHGETCTLTAKPNNGYAFVNWTENDTEVSHNVKYSFEATYDRHLTAHFNKTAPTSPNEIFIGSYSGSIYLNGTATAPQFETLSQPIDSMEFKLDAEITAGANDNSVNVVFTIDGESYETTGTVSQMQINFGTLSYTYVESPSTFQVDLDLTGRLDTNKNKLNLSGPFNGTGNVTIEGFPLPLDLTTVGTVTGTLLKK